jgi:histidine triad (HIT) family protein
MSESNVFLKILSREIPAKIAHEDDVCLAFHDNNPQAPVHVLVIPKRVVRTHGDLTGADRELIAHLNLVAVELAKKLGLTDGYRLVVNSGDAGGQVVPHLHLHLLGGRAFHWPPG